MSNLEICNDCIYADQFRDNPEDFTETLDRFSEAGFTCEGAIKECIGSPFAVPLPRIKKMCGLDKALESALSEAGYNDSSEDNEGRTLFFKGLLDLHPAIETNNAKNAK